MSERVDVHHHYYAPAYNAFMAGTDEGIPGIAKGWSPAGSLDDMDRNGVGQAYLSAAADAEFPAEVARSSNAYAAGLVRAHPGRFGLFALLPLPDVEASLREVAYALDELGADGVGLLTSYGGTYVGERAFWPLFEELDRRGAVAFVHPCLNQCCADMVADVGPAVVEFGTDTTRAIASLVFSGAAVKFPRIRFIFSHAGGTMPFLIGRFVNLGRTPKMKERLPDGVLPELRRFYYDTAQAAHRGAMSSLRELVSIEHVLFGTDYPYRVAEEQLAGLAACGFSAGELRAIEGANARALLAAR